MKHHLIAGLVWPVFLAIANGVQASKSSDAWAKQQFSYFDFLLQGVSVKQAICSDQNAAFTDCMSQECDGSPSLSGDCDDTVAALDAANNISKCTALVSPFNIPRTLTAFLH